jgi:hypothetical protein
MVRQSFSAPCYGTDMPKKGQWYKGFESNIVLERELEEPYGEIEANQYFIDLSYGLKSWLSLDGKLGIGDFTYRPDNSYKIDYDTNFAGGYGFRIRVFQQERYNLKGVLGFQHVSLHPGAENINNDKNEAILDDWQLSGLISKGFGFLTPYAGCKFSKCYLVHKVNEDTRKRRESDEPSLGIVLGADVSIRKDWKINLEGRFIDETAFSLGLGTLF